MAEPVIYMRGLRPPVEAIAANTDMLADLNVLAGLSDEQVDTICQRLSEAVGFLAPKNLAALVSDTVEDERAVRALQRAVRNLEHKDVPNLLEALTNAQKEESFPLDSQTLDRLRKVLPTLIQPYSALVRFEKAERLSTLTGQELESIELICDLRPVFDEDREHIEGMMPYTRLRVVAIGADGLPNAFEAELTEQQVDDLAKKASKATTKLTVLRTFVRDWQQEGLPELPLTVAAGVEVRNA